MKLIVTILSIFICQIAVCQTSTYTAEWSVIPTSSVKTFEVQRSSDNTNWITDTTINYSDTSYSVPFKAYANNFIRIKASDNSNVWYSPTIQIIAVLPVVISKAAFIKKKYIVK